MIPSLPICQGVLESCYNDSIFEVKLPAFQDFEPAPQDFVTEEHKNRENNRS